MRRALIVILAGSMLSMSWMQVAAAAQGSCSDPTNPVCNGGASVVADQQHGEFHGLIMVSGQPDVLETAAHSGTQPGCGDCEWTLILACLHDSPSDTGPDTTCLAGATRKCPRGQFAYRLYLSTTTESNRLVQEICLGSTNEVIPVGDIAAGDVDRYLKNVRPPDLTLTFQPPRGAIADLPTYFAVRPPADLRPVPFGGGQVAETITIAPEEYQWIWGDGDATGWITDAGGPYPTGTLTHTYAAAGHLRGALTTRWGGKYTITVDGETFGPYDAVGTVTHTQAFTVPVAAAHSHLVSHA
jgi:hypothetical protein